MNIITKDIYNNLELLTEDLQGWNGSSTIFHDLIKESNPDTIIEVGTWKGQSAINMGKYCKDNKLSTQIYCVDTWLGALEFWGDLKDTPERNLLLKNGYPQIYYQFLSNVVHNEVQDYITPLPMTSLIGAKYFESQKMKAELIYIDASHDYVDVIRDIKAYYDLLTPNGIIFGDDYEAWQDVKKAVNEFATVVGIDKLTIYENNFWTFRK